MDVQASGFNFGEKNTPPCPKVHELPEYRENNGFICQNKPVGQFDIYNYLKTELVKQGIPAEDWKVINAKCS